MLLFLLPSMLATDVGIIIPEVTVPPVAVLMAWDEIRVLQLEQFSRMLEAGNFSIFILELELLLLLDGGAVVTVDQLVMVLELEVSFLREGID